MKFFTNPARTTRVACVLSSLFLVVGLAAPAMAQDDDDDDGMDDGAGDTGEPGDGGEPVAMPPGTPVPPELGAAALVSQPDVLVCDGGWRYPLIETREEIGPARFARQLDLQKDLELSSHAFGYCATAAAKKFSGRDAIAKGPCAGLMSLADRVDLAASNLFRLNDASSCECLTKPVEESGRCEGLREQLTTLRRYGHVLVQRAELVLATQVCASPERGSNADLRAACHHLEHTTEAQASKGMVGRFSLSAPLPTPVAAAIARVTDATDGRYLSVLPENFLGVRQSLCKLPPVPVKTNQCAARTLDTAPNAPGAKPGKPDGDPMGPGAFAGKMQEVTWGMCNELALADVNAATCRDADVYIDERGQIHLNRSLTTREQRKNATLCIDISDFDENHPLMVTLGLDPTGSVPKRLWPGETMRIGRLLDRPVTPQDILHINVSGKARGISLAEVLRINAVSAAEPGQRREACRIARSWVPVVDHEVPVGKPSKQAVIPIQFNRGRDGETRKINEGDYVLVWVRDIEPAGSVFVEYAAGQVVGYQPPPLLGAALDPTQPPLSPDKDDILRPGGRLRGGTLGVDAPILPRRARYPGSRILRLGAPQGNHAYNLKICRTVAVASATAKCGDVGSNVLVDEKMYVHGDSHFGVKFHFGYNYFPIQELEARRTPAAQAAGSEVYEVVERSRGLATYDVAGMLAIYPFGRNPLDFSYNPLSKKYWKHSALLMGFTMRRLEPWEQFYIGAALPLANGVTLDLMSAFSKRDVPTDVEVGQLVNTSDLTTITGKKSALAIGVSIGVSFDMDLFERAFTKTWERLSRPTPKFIQDSSNEVVPATVSDIAMTDIGATEESYDY